MDETFFVIEGSFVFELDGQPFDAPAGTVVFLPRGTRHRFRSTGASHGRVLSFAAPGGIDRFFEEVADPSVRMDKPSTSTASRSTILEQSDLGSAGGAVRDADVRKLAVGAEAGTAVLRGIAAAGPAVARRIARGVVARAAVDAIEDGAGVAEARARGTVHRPEWTGPGVRKEIAH
jgi:hypothetical protein